MELLVFAGIFLVVNCILWKWDKNQLGEPRANDYLHVKGSVRGIFGRVATKEWVEKKRRILNSRKSKM
ncbi:MAG: hypothetical protein KH381_07480 [Clostridium sp.]|nr:hypothetical protein [Clostridium sp.]